MALVAPALIIAYIAIPHHAFIALKDIMNKMGLV